MDWCETRGWGPQIKRPSAEGQVLGIVGLGRIGRAVRLGPGIRTATHRIRPVRVSRCLPGRGRGVGGFGPAAFARPIIVTLHTPLTDETRGLIAKRRSA